MNILKLFLESDLTHILNEKRGDPSFCYMLYVDKSEESPFVDMQRDLDLDGDLVKSGKFHATVRYIKSEDYEPFLEYMKELDLPTVSGKCVGFDIYGKEKDTLVVELEGEELHSWFKKINKWLTDHDYPESDYATYKPHISLTEKAGIEKPKWKKEYEKSVQFKLHVVTNSNYDEIFRSKSNDHITEKVKVDICNLFLESSMGMIPIFRGESKYGSGSNYWSTDFEFARQFTQSGLDSEVSRGFIAAKDVANLLPSANSEEAMTQAIKKAQASGFKAIRVSEGRGQPDSIFVMDPSCIKRA